MSPIFKKLNLKGETVLIVLNAPVSFERVLSELDGVKVERDLDTANEPQSLLAFAENTTELRRLATAAIEKTRADIPLWFALRFRRVKFIRSFTRDSKWALSSEGKARGRQ